MIATSKTLAGVTTWDELSAILYLEGIPEIARYDKILVGDNPRQQIQDSLTLESKGVSTYNEGVKLCLEVGDSGSRDLMERMVVESETSIDWAETQLDLIERIGLERYLAQHIGEGGSD